MHCYGTPRAGCIACVSLLKTCSVTTDAAYGIWQRLIASRSLNKTPYQYTTVYTTGMQQATALEGALTPPVQAAPPAQFTP